MDRQTIIKHSVYAVVIILSLLALLLVWLAPPGLLSGRVVYQGF